jgi:hypothetical protein
MWLRAPRAAPRWERVVRLVLWGLALFVLVSTGLTAIARHKPAWVRSLADRLGLTR